MTTITPTIATINSQNWIVEAYNDMQLAANPDGLLGALQNSKYADGSIAGFLNQAQSNANLFAAIAQDNLQSSTSTTPAHIVASAYDQAQSDAIQANLTAGPPVNYTPPAQLDPIIFFDDGSTIDTVNNILTRSDGTQIDTTTGTPIVKAGSIINMPDGSYLNTDTNILTMPDGTQIDTVTGLKVSSGSTTTTTTTSGS